MTPQRDQAGSRALDVEIRQATVDDLASMRRLAAAAFDREPIQRAALVDLLFHRPLQDPALRVVAVAGKSLVGFALAFRAEQAGYVDAIAVEHSFRRRGIGTALLAAAEDGLLQRAAPSLRVGGNTWFYAWPGVDLAYTAALSFLERAGYERAGLAQNMDVDLDGWIPGSAQQALDRHAARVVVSRAQPAAWPEIEALIKGEFSDVWRHETHRAVHRDVPTVFTASRDGRVVGFGCHGVYRRDWFGPLATAPEERGNGVGEALLRLCLDDLAAAGVATAQIGWIGPMSFYSRTVGARCGRQFIMLEKPVAPGADVPGAHSSGTDD